MRSGSGSGEFRPLGRVSRGAALLAHAPVLVRTRLTGAGYMYRSFSVARVEAI